MTVQKNSYNLYYTQWNVTHYNFDLYFHLYTYYIACQMLLNTLSHICLLDMTKPWAITVIYSSLVSLTVSTLLSLRFWSMSVWIWGHSKKIKIEKHCQVRYWCWMSRPGLQSACQSLQSCAVGWRSRAGHLRLRGPLCCNRTQPSPNCCCMISDNCMCTPLKCLTSCSINSEGYLITLAKKQHVKHMPKRHHIF